MFKSASYEFKGPFSVGEIADYLGVEVTDEVRAKSISDIAPLDVATEDHFSFFDNGKYLEQFKSSSAGICVVSKRHANQAPEGMIVLAVKDPHRAYALISNMFYTEKTPKDLIHPTAVIHKNAKIADDVIIGANSVIEDGVEIAAGTKIASNVTIKATKIGKNCIIHTGVRLGQDGFGFSMSAEGFLKIPQLGGVVIGNGVEIGANTTIDRGAGPNTIIGDFTKIDNLVQIGHNVEIGKFCVLVSQVGVAGSTKVGDYVILGGQVGVSGHLTIGQGVQVAAGSGLIKSVPAGAKIGGYPAMNIRDWHKTTIAVNNLIKKSGEK